jgi:hypothetical protein
MFFTQASILVHHHRRSAAAAGRLPTSRGGISLVEVLIGLAIGAILFTALTTAISAGIHSAQGNVDYFNTIQRARIAMLRLSSDLRNCYAADLEDATGSDGQLISGKALRIQPKSTVPPPIVAYRWMNTTLNPNQLRYYSNALDATAGGNRVASNVTSLTFQTQLKLNAKTNNLDVTNVIITMTVVSGQDSITLSESVAPRCVMTTK